MIKNFMESFKKHISWKSFGISFLVVWTIITSVYMFNTIYVNFTGSIYQQGSRDTIEQLVNFLYKNCSTSFETEKGTMKVYTSDCEKPIKQMGTGSLDK